MSQCKRTKYLKISLFILIYNVSSIVFSEKKFNKKGLPTIIWWSDMLFPHLNNSQVISCPYSKCISVKKRNYYNPDITIAYIFYGTDFDGEKLPLPRKHNHIWALLHEESPLNNFLYSHLPGIRLFNYTSTFSRESNHPLTTQYIPSIDYLTNIKPLPITEKNKFRLNGTAPILYLQSHCHVPSDRDRYVKDLMNYIQVDSYGECLHNKDLPPHLTSTDTHNDEELFHFISKYKFHIAFENAICEDYVTEKLIRALHVGSIPIYRGSPSVKDWTPSEKSVIVTNEFESPKKLAEYLLMLDKNDDLYNDYLEYKNIGVTNEFLKETLRSRTWGVHDVNKIDFIHSFECYVCDKISKQSPPSTGNQKHMNCSQPKMSIDTNQFLLFDEWHQQDWIETYLFAFDQARAIELMLKNQEQNSKNFMQYIAQTYNKVSY